MDTRGWFGGAVVNVGDELSPMAVMERLRSPAEQQPQQEIKEPMPDPVLQGLLKLNPKNAEARAERDALISERIASNERARTLIEAELQKDHDALHEQHRDCRARGREQEKVVGDLVTKVAEQMQELNRLEGVLVAAMSGLEVANMERQSLRRFAEDAGVAKADAEITKAKKRVERAHIRKAKAVQEHNYIVLVLLPPEQKK